MIAEIIVKCVAPNTACTYFTHGKKYPAWHHVGRVFRVEDDHGRERYLIPNERSAHLVPHGEHFNPDQLGRFEEV